jgi:hypothetical protein
MNCTCPEGYELTPIQVFPFQECTKITVLTDIQCPEGCTLVLTQDGNAHCNCLEVVEPILTNVVVPVEINPNDFEDVSWTVAYSPVLGSWMSFYSFKPNYYINHNNYFQTGMNVTSDYSEFGLWSHLLTNKSYQVFYGKKQPFTVEYPIKEEFVTKTLNNVQIWTEAKRYHNDYDYATSIGLTFNKSMIYNNIVCSGNINLIPEKTKTANSKNYPKTNTNGTQDIMITNPDGFKWNYDYFYNRVKSNTNNIPFLLQDKNQIDKFVNSNAVSFKGKALLERMVGDWFLNRITYDKDSRYSIALKFTLNESDI